MIDVLWACRSSVKTAMGFSPFSLVYGTKAISPVELVVPTPRVILEESQEDTNNERRIVDLEGVEEERELARRRSQRYQQRMTRAYV